MAKGNLILGMGRGSIGDITLYRRGGNQISRARARVVKNPQTDSQRLQRIIISTVAKAYSQMKPICDHSWQGISYGADSMAEFQRMNSNLLRNRIAVNGLENEGLNYLNTTWFWSKGGVSHNGAVPNAWTISKGTLQTIEAEPVDGYESESNYGVTITSSAPTDCTYKQLADLLGINLGDQLTVCAIGLNGRFYYGRFIVAANDGDEAALITNTAKWNERNVNITAQQEGANINLTLTDLESNVTEQGATGFACYGVILSRKQGDSWQRSQTQMRLLDVDMAGAGVSMNDALFLEDSAIDFASPYYLNNANRPSGTTDEEGGGDDEENP